MKYPTHKPLRYLLWFGIIAGILPYFLLSYFAQPQADDYFFSAWFMEMGLGEYMKANLTCCNGRYFGVLLAGLNPLSFEQPDLYFLVPLLSLAALLLSIVYLLKQALPKEWVHILPLLSAGSFLLLLNGLPSPAEGIYWANASVFHLWANILLLFFLGLLLWQIENRWKKRLRGFMLIICTIAIPGMNELSLALLLGILVVRLFLLSRKAMPSERRFTWILLAFSLAGLITVLLLPGTSSRISALPHSWDVISAAGKGFELSVYLIGQQVQQPAFIIWCIIMLVLFSQMNQSPLLRIFDGFKHKWIIPPGSLVIIFLLYFTSVLLLGDYPPWRVHNTVAIAFQVLCFLNIFLLSRWKRQEIKHFAHSWLAQALPFVMLWFVFSDFTIKDPRQEVVFRANTSAAWHELLFSARGYKDAVDDRHFRLMQAGESDTLFLPPLPEQCELLNCSDIESNPKALNNSIMAYYFKVGAITLDTNSRP